MRRAVKHLIVLPADHVQIDQRQPRLDHARDHQVQPQVRLAAVIGAAIGHQQDLGPGLLQRLGHIGMPGILADRRADAHAIDHDRAPPHRPRKRPAFHRTPHHSAGGASAPSPPPGRPARSNRRCTACPPRRPGRRSPAPGHRHSRAPEPRSRQSRRGGRRASGSDPAVWYPVMNISVSATRSAPASRPCAQNARARAAFPAMSPTTGFACTSVSRKVSVICAHSISLDRTF